MGSYFQSSRIVIADQAVAPPPATRPPVRERLRAVWDLVIANRSFTRFELRAFVYTASIGISLPVLPLFYVQDLAASRIALLVVAAIGFAAFVLFAVDASVRRTRRGSARNLVEPAVEPTPSGR